jgi:hypothetical protein
MGLFSCKHQLNEDVYEAYLQLPDTIDFNFHVRPILSDRCYPCHGPDENARQTELRLDDPAQVFAKLKDSEKIAVVPEKPYQSVLVNKILDDDPEVTMPPPESKLFLAAEEKAILIRWIEQG